MKKVMAIVTLTIFAMGICAFSMAGNYVASKTSNKYHASSCAIAQKIAHENLLTFNTPEEAIQAGYGPCKTCNPPKKTVAFIGSKGSDKYHLPNCSIAAKIAPERQITFASEEEARKSGYLPCQICIKPAAAATTTTAATVAK